MMMTTLIGVLTGFVSAMLFASASTGTALGVLVLFFLSPMPVAIAGIGWNSRAALIATGVAAATIMALSRGRLAGPLFYVMALGAPAVLLSHFVLLARPGPGGAPGTGPASEPAPQPSLEWYPLGRIVAFAAVWAGVLGSIAMLMIYADLDTVMPTLRKAIAQVAAQGYPMPGGKRTAAGAAVATAEQVDAMARLMLALMPGMVAVLWFAVAMVNLWLAGASVYAAGRLKRPWPDLAGLSLPRWLSIVLAVSLAGSFLDGTAGRMAGAFAAGCLAATTLSGLAILHFVTRGHPLRSLILLAAYVTLFVIPPISAAGISLLALAEPILAWNRRGPPPSSPHGPPPTGT